MDWNVYFFIQKPAYQALFFLILTIVLLLVIRPKSSDKAWSIAVFVFAFFLIVNAGILWFDESPWRYFFYSIGCAIGYILLIGVVMEGLLNLLGVEGSGESAMAFLVIIYQPVILLLVMLMKWLVL